jgi:hypothetical protein
MSDRVRQAYLNHGILKPGDDFLLAYDNRISFRQSELVIRQPPPAEQSPISLVEVEYRNNTSEEQSVQFNESRTTSTTLSATVITGFRAKKTFGAKVNIKQIFEIGGSQEFEFSLSVAGTVSTTTSQTWSWNWPIRVPAKSRVKATALVSTFYRQPGFVSDCEIRVAPHPDFDPGYNPLYVRIRRAGGGKEEWWRSSLAWALYPPGDGFRSGRDINTVFHRSEGFFDGVVGKSLLVRIDGYPIDQIGGAPRSSKTYLVDDGASLLETANAELEDNAAVLKSLS